MSTDGLNGTTKSLLAVIVCLWTALAATIGFAIRDPVDPVLSTRVSALEQRIEERLLEIHRRLDEISQRIE